jgi:hypothetical protein
VIPSVVLKILDLAGILASDAEEKLSELQDEYPNYADVVERFKGWILPQLNNAVGLDAATALVAKVGLELWSGKPGYNPNHPGVA